MLEKLQKAMISAPLFKGLIYIPEAILEFAAI